MRYYVWPSLFVLIGVSSLVFLSYGLGDRALSRRTPEQLATMQRSFASPFQRLSGFVTAGLCLLGAVTAVLVGSATAWLWLLALLLQLVVLRQRGVAALRLAAISGQQPAPTPADAHQLQRTYRFTVVAAIAFLTAQVVRVFGPTESPGTILASSLLMLVVVGAALAAGWSAVWVSSTPRSGPRSRGGTEANHSA